MRRAVPGHVCGRNLLCLAPHRAVDARTMPLSTCAEERSCEPSGARHDLADDSALRVCVLLPVRPRTAGQLPLGRGVDLAVGGVRANVVAEPKHGSDLVTALPVASGDELRRLLERHVRHTGSERGQTLLARWDEAVREFRHVVPKADVAAVEDEHEGTLPGGKHAEADGAAAATP